MYVISKLDINLLMSDKDKFIDKLEKILTAETILDIENFNSKTSIKELIKILIPFADSGNTIIIQFSNRNFKITLDKIAKKQYIALERQERVGHLKRWKIKTF